MRPEPAPRMAGEPAAPLAVGFADLFDALGTSELRYSGRARELSGRAVAIDGFLAQPHVPQSALLLVDQPGVCPDCSPVPAAAITLVGLRDAPHCAPVRATDSARHGNGNAPVRVIGRLDFGFRVDNGVASMLRIEDARVEQVADIS